MRRILFYESRPEWGGAQKCELDLLISLEDDSTQTYFLSSTDGPMIDRIKTKEKDYTIIPINESVNQIRKEQVKMGILFSLMQLFRMLPHLLAVSLFIIRNKIDIVYTSQFRSQLMVGWLAKLLGRKVIWHIHGEEQLHLLLGKVSVATSDKIIVVSKALMNRYQELYPKKPGKFTTVHNGIELPMLKKKKDNERFTISMVGTIIVGKRQDLAITACAKLKQAGFNVQLNIIGEKPPWHSNEYMDSLQGKIQEFNLSDTVSFLGWLENPFEKVSQSNVVILPSDTEGLPLSIIEAMAMGIPSISTNVGGISELIVHEETGFIINPDDLDDLVSKLKILLTQPLLCKTMGHQARKRYEAYFTKESFIKGVAGVINTIE